MNKCENLNLFGPLYSWQKQNFTTTYSHDFVNHYPTVRINKKSQVKSLPKIENQTVKLKPIDTKFDRLPAIKKSDRVIKIPKFVETSNKGLCGQYGNTSIKSRYVKLPPIVDVGCKNPVEKKNARYTDVRNKIDTAVNSGQNGTKAKAKNY